MNYYNHNSAFYFARELKRIIPDESKVFQVDYSGIISFFSGKKIINGDGLINSFEYYQQVKAGKLHDYIKRINPQFLVFYTFKNPVEGDSLHYKFKLFKDYEFVIHKSKILYRHPLLYGGIFRRKLGNFYLVELNDYKLKAN